jgi:uncharacterized membrane protein YqgA involved in biofilm formation
MFPGFGTTLNIVAIIIGSVIGILIGKKLSEKFRRLITDVLGCVTAISAADALSSYWDASLTQALPQGGAILVVVFSLLIGAAIGSWLKIEESLEVFGEKLKSKFDKKEESNFVEGFVSASLVFAIGPLAILGSISDGMGTGIDQLVLKSTLDGFTSIAFAASLGWGVALSSLPVGIYQFIWTAIGISLRLLRIKDVAVANLLPAIALAPLIALLFESFK